MSTLSNKELVAKFVDTIWNQRDLESAKALIHDNIQYTSPRMTMNGKEEYVSVVGQYMEIVADSEVKVIDLVAEGNKVVSLLEMRGSHSAPYGDIQATGNEISMQLMAIVEIKDHKIYRETEVFDELGMLLAMGAEVVQKQHN